MMPSFLYLHGFASSPQSQKAKEIEARFAHRGLTLHVPDLNLGDFTEITLTAQLQFIQAEYVDRPLIVIGSSLGGFLAVQLAAINPLVEKIFLLAPAFEFSRCISERLGADEIEQWRTTGTLEVYHYGIKQNLPLKYNFYVDAQTYDDRALKRDLPISIVHGRRDEVVPFSLSENFAASRPNVRLTPVDDDHSLGNSIEVIWDEIEKFLNMIVRRCL